MPITESKRMISVKKNPPRNFEINSVFDIRYVDWRTKRHGFGLFCRYSTFLKDVNLTPNRSC